MSERVMVCMHCGSDDFYVNVTVSGWQNLSPITLGDDGQPYYYTTSPVEVDNYDGDVESFVCNGCREEATRLQSIAVLRPAEGDTPIAPCGRCDHSLGDHDKVVGGPCAQARALGYTRRAMPCEHEGCDCHDYYDRQFAEAQAS